MAAKPAARSVDGIGAGAVKVAVPETFPELLTQIRARFDTLSPSHKLLAERVMADPETVAFMTISELASAVGVNEATVVRFSSGLGLKGYPGLTKLCRERLQEQAQMLRRFDRLEQMGDSAAEMIKRTVELDQSNISRTFARIDDATWDSAVAQLAGAARVHVMGMRKTHGPAYLLGYLLRLLREDVEIITASLGGLTDEMRRVRPGDCFVAVSIHRYSTATVRAAEWAHQCGAHVIAMTDNPSSPLAKWADDVFYLDASSTSVLRSMTAFTSLSQALANGVAQIKGHSVRDTLLLEERLLQDFGVYSAEASPPEPR
ncbi:MurR/RpiR family transcriptional regulator [Rhodococcus sp. H29-C3]|uniref:MurR/RpiR family transcriptional regulator n=1 Tax=Rhodococcus sp. H29-C3 TaxID=3046307 RepID=UPI0024BA628E|nr:MurR/RpiR family transcriptional regulator [Rhodococcus sp. H29-C3]MDJ0361925.1 MurR/RpiR family transcriptional regulator [Rhodococcus sp. H29-C3]